MGPCAGGGEVHHGRGGPAEPPLECRDLILAVLRITPSKGATTNSVDATADVTGGDGDGTGAAEVASPVVAPGSEPPLRHPQGGSSSQRLIAHWPRLRGRLGLDRGREMPRRGWGPLVSTSDGGGVARDGILLWGCRP